MANNEDDFEEMYSSEEQYEEVNSIKRAAKKELNDATKKAAKKAGTYLINAGSTAVKRGILALLPYIGAILLIILAIILLISILVFIFSGPDMLRGQIVQMADELWTQIKSALVSVTEGDDYAEVTEQHVLDVAKYIDLMGFDLVGYGFVTDEEKEDLQENEAGEITAVSSDALVEYLAAENRTYMLSTVSISSLLRWWDGVSIFPVNQEATPEGAQNSEFGTGMLNVSTQIDAVEEIIIDGQRVEWDELASENSNGAGGIPVELTITPDIDRENRKLVLTINEKKNVAGQLQETETKCIYNLDGWTGRYGKPIEFLLAMHLGTMAPDFAESIATRQEFDTKVNIRLHKTVEVVRLKYRGMTLDETKQELDNRVKVLWNYMQQVNAAQRRPVYSYQNAVEQAQNDIGVTYAEIEDARDYEEKNTKEKYTPYITSVENHWYRDLKFKDLKVASSDDAYVETRPTTVNSKYNKFDVTTYKSGEIYQVKEPIRSDVNETLEDLFTNGEWEKVDGINGFITSGTTAVKSKITLGDDMKNVIVMLERAAQTSDDAKYVLRDLKEWVTSKGVKFQDEKILTSKVTNEEEDWDLSGSLTGGNGSSSSGGSSSGSGNSGTSTSNSYRLKNLLGGKTAQILYNGNDATIKTAEMPNRTGVYSAVGGSIEKISDNAVQIRITSPSNLKDKIFIMSGVQMDSALKVGDKISTNTPIAETVAGKDMVIKMQDESRNSISVRDNLI